MIDDMLDSVAKHRKKKTGYPYIIENYIFSMIFNSVFHHHENIS